MTIITYAKNKFYSVTCNPVRYYVVNHPRAFMYVLLHYNNTSFDIHLHEHIIVNGLTLTYYVFPFFLLFCYGAVTHLLV